MKKVKARFLVVVLGLCLILMGAQATWAYQFTYVGGGFSSQSEVQNVSNGGDPASDAAIPAWNESYAFTNATANVSDPYVYAYVSGYGQWTASGSSLHAEVVSTASGSSEASSGRVSAYNRVVMTAPDITTAIFFRIDGGVTSSPVRINYSWDASAMIGDGGTAVLGGGVATPMYLSLNEYSVQTPLHPIWQKDAVKVDNNGDGYYSELVNGYFMAQVGDIIGINLAADVNLDFSGQSNSLLSMAFSSMQLDAVPLPPSAWLFGSGLLGLLAWGGFRPRRR